MPVGRWLPFLLILVLALPTPAANHRWTLHGPFGGYIYALAYDPVDPSIAYAATGIGLFRSIDGGQHWTMAPLPFGRSVVDLAVAQSDPNIVYASSPWGLYKSMDRGITWKLAHGFGSFAVAVSRTDANVVYSAATGGPIRSADGGVTFGDAGSGLANIPGVTSIAVDPLDANIVYITTFGEPGLFRSADGGAHWTAINNGVAAASITQTIAVHPTTPQTLYLGTLGAMYRTLDSGASWMKLNVVTPTTSMSAYAFAFNPSLPFTIYAGTERGVIRSTNGGTSWTVPLQLSSAFAVAADPIHPQNVLAALGLDLFRSTDGAATFTPANDGLTAFYTDTIAVDPKNPAVVYASGPAGTSKSTDRGKTWTRLSSLRIVGGVVDPSNSSILYGISDGTLRRSTDGGITWFPLSGGGPVPAGVLHEVDLDPRNPGTIYVVISGTVYRRVGTGPWETSAGPPNGQAQFVTVDPTSSALYAGGSDGLFRSTNGGSSWSSIATPLEGSILGAAVDPFDANHLFAWNFFHNVAESRDGGATWTARPGVAANLTFDPSTQGVVYARSSGLQRSTDGGATFGAIGPQDGSLEASVFAVAPDGNTIYTGGTTGGVWTYEFGRRRAATH